MKIKNITLNGNLLLAPMAGVTDLPFRKLCRDMGAALSYTEMISVKGLLHNNKNTERLLMTAENEHPAAVQLFGHEPVEFEQAIKSGMLDKFDIIDINMGCPAPKIIKNGDGSALLKNLPLAEEIIKACVNSTTKPITVKFRTGFAAHDNIAVEFAKMCERAGAAAITIHGRTRAQQYMGMVDLETIKAVAAAVNIPVIGNGDVADKESLQRMLNTGVSGVMIGRGCLGNPELFATLQNKKPAKSRLSIMLEHIQLLKEQNGLIGNKKPQPKKELVVVKEFRKHLLWYVKGITGAAELRRSLMHITKLDEIEEAIKKIFSQQ